MDLKSLSQHREKGDCAVRTVAVTTDTPYEVVYKLMETLGRKAGRGTDWPIIVRTFNKLGFAMVYTRTPCRTIRTLERDLPNEGSYLISVSDHVAGYRDGQVYDWAAGRCHHIRSVWRIKRFRVLTKIDKRRLMNGTLTPSGKMYNTKFYAGGPLGEW